MQTIMKWDERIDALGGYSTANIGCTGEAAKVAARDAEIADLRTALKAAQHDDKSNSLEFDGIKTPLEGAALDERAALREQIEALRQALHEIRYCCAVPAAQAMRQIASAALAAPVPDVAQAIIAGIERRKLEPKTPVGNMAAPLPVQPAAQKGEKGATCTVPPPGLYCTRTAGHDGPCAAYPTATD